MPPVQTTTSAPCSIISRMEAVTFLSSSFQVTWLTTSPPYSFNFSTTTGVKVSLMRPLYTSFPVVTIPTFLGRNGFSSSRGLPPVSSFAMFLARSILSSSITRGIIRVPASLSPLCTGKSPWRVAIIICPKPLTAFSASRFTFKRPSRVAVISIFPSFAWERSICSPRHMAHRISAASFS